MMKLVVAETYYPEGHKMLNDRYLDLLSTMANLILVDDGTYFDSQKWSSKVCQRIHVRALFSKRIEILKTLCHIVNLIRVAWAVRNVEYDKILFLSTHNAAMYFALPFFKRDKVIVMHHYDIDRTAGRRIESLIFKQYANKIRHIVLADFIKEGLSTLFGIKPQNMFVVHQPSLQIAAQTDSTREPFIIGLGRNNSESLIRELIELDKNAHTPKHLRLVMRSRGITYQGNSLDVFDRYLSREEYDAFLYRAAACIVYYPQTYRYRYSGVIDDALYHQTPIICNNLPIGEYFERTYPTNCKVINDAKDIWKFLNSDYSAFDKDEYRTFLWNHCDATVKHQLELALS